jgi:hypothetical protein
MIFQLKIPLGFFYGVYQAGLGKSDKFQNLFATNDKIFLFHFSILKINWKLSAPIWNVLI